MTFDFKKEYKEYYRPKNKPEIINIPQFNFIAIRGKGNPNEENGMYQQAIHILYAVAYTLKMSYKTEYKAFMNMLFHHLKAFGGKKIRKMWIIYIKKSFIGFQLLDCLILFLKKILIGQ